VVIVSECVELDEPVDDLVLVLLRVGTIPMLQPNWLCALIYAPELL
jgi:hypothetical protein